MKRSFLRLLFLAWVLVPVLWACTPDQDDTGIVARVNGRPITLERLQVRYDFKQLSTVADNPGVAGLKREYGGILADILVEELVAQELETLGLSVTPQELADAEEDVRADYPEGAFEEVLVEEYIDIDSWRQELKSRLTMEKFFHEVLRPGIAIGYEEAEAYYREHIQDFYLPSRVRFYLVSGPSRDAIESVLERYREGEAIEDQARKFDRVSVREVRVREDQLTASWKNALKGLKPGEAGPVLTSQGGYEALLYQEAIPAKVLDPSQAYPVVERMLLDNKLREAFDGWLEDELSVARISVSPHLPLAAPGADKAESSRTALQPAEEGFEGQVEGREQPGEQDLSPSEAPPEGQAEGQEPTAGETGAAQ